MPDKQKRGWKYPPLVGAPVAMRTLPTQTPETQRLTGVIRRARGAHGTQPISSTDWRAALIS